MTGGLRQTSKARKLRSDNNVALGDILTLIFGFFVLMVTLNKFAIVQDPGISPKDSLKISGSREIVHPGAIVSSSRSMILTISEKEFQRIALGKELLHVPESIRNNSRRITIEACVSKRGVEKEDQRLWERSAARAQRVGALLGTSGVATERITVRTLGGHCEVINLKDKEKQAVAVSLE